jgi:putative ABC transport system permease protein
MSQGIVGFTSAPYVFTSLERARRRYGAGLVPPGSCSYFLVKARPGTNLQTLSARIRERVPALAVHDRDTYSRMCATHWLFETGIGFGVGLTTLLGLAVGLGVVAQTLYASVTERLREFAMLKALGADERCVGRFLLTQGLGNAVIGSLIGVTLSQLLGQMLTSPRAPVVMQWRVTLLSVVLVTLVCCLAAWLPYWRVRRIDPASVLRS